MERNQMSDRSNGRFWIFVLVLLLMMTSVEIGETQQGASPTRVVLKGATLIDGTGKPALPNAVIVIDADKITAVGGPEMSFPASAEVVDLSGKFVIPGLVDSHVHYQRWLGELLLNHGITTVLSMSARDTYGEDVYRASQKPEVRSPRLYDYGTALALSPSMTNAQVHEMVQAWLKREPQFAKLPSYNDRVKQPYAWLTAAIHDAGLLTIGHAEDCVDAAKAGLDIIEHLWGCAVSLMSAEERDNFQKGDYLHWGLFFKDKPSIDRVIKEAIGRGGKYINPTLLYEFSSQTDMAPQFEADTASIYRDAALMSYYPKSLAEALLMKFRITRSFSTKYGTQVMLAYLNNQELQQSKEAYRRTGDFVKRWTELGGKIIGGVDTPSIGTAGLAVHMEMTMLVESGLTPMQALQSQGVWGAEMLTAKRKTVTQPPVGLIAPGSFADLVVLTANPLDNIQNSRKIERVMKGGRFIRLGYTPDYASPPNGIVRSTPYIQEPEISAIMPNQVTEGSEDFELVVDGEGFQPYSVVRVDGVSIPTTFIDIRTLRARIPAAMVAQAVPNRFVLGTNPEQRVGLYGDRTVKITVFTGPPDGGLSNSVSLKVLAKANNLP
jgi:hypothetical protein